MRVSPIIAAARLGNEESGSPKDTERFGSATCQGEVFRIGGQTYVQFPVRKKPEQPAQQRRVRGSPG